MPTVVSTSFDEVLSLLEWQGEAKSLEEVSQPGTSSDSPYIPVESAVTAAGAAGQGIEAPQELKTQASQDAKARWADVEDSDDDGGEVARAGKGGRPRAARPPAPAGGEEDSPKSTAAPSTDAAEVPDEDTPKEEARPAPAAAAAKKDRSWSHQWSEEDWWEWQQGGQGQHGSRRSRRNSAWKSGGAWKTSAWWTESEQHCAEEEHSWEVERDKRATTRGGGRRAGVAGGARSQQKQIEDKRQCQFTIGIEEESKFRVVRKIIGLHGAHVKAIAEQSLAKLRLRGRGSKFLEGDEQQESTDPLMLCVSAPDRSSYDKAVELITELLERVYGEYRVFCEKSKLPVRDLRIQNHEGRREGGY